MGGQTTSEGFHAWERPGDWATSTGAQYEPVSVPQPSRISPLKGVQEPRPVPLHPSGHKSSTLTPSGGLAERG